MDIFSEKTWSIGRVEIQFQLFENKFIAIDGTQSGKELIIFNIETFEKILLQDHFQMGVRRLIKNNLIVNDGLAILMSLSLVDGKYIWKIDLEEGSDNNSTHLTRITREMASVGDNLWVPSIINAKGVLLRIDVNTGQIIWISPDTLSIDPYGIKQIEDRNNLFSLFGVYDRSNPVSPFVEIDGTNGNIVREGITDSLFKEKLIISKWIYQENRIYFTARREMLTSNYIGVLDYDTLELLWYDEVPGRKGDLRDIQVSQNKLYVLDAAGTLHIFEETHEVTPQNKPQEIRPQVPTLSRFKTAYLIWTYQMFRFFKTTPIPSAVLRCSTAMSTSFRHF